VGSWLNRPLTACRQSVEKEVIVFLLTTSVVFMIHSDVAFGRNLLNKFLSSHMLTINRVITLLTVLDILNFIVRAERGA